jgi:hypothetical protein
MWGKRPLEQRNDDRHHVKLFGQRTASHPEIWQDITWILGKQTKKEKEGDME